MSDETIKEFFTCDCCDISIQECKQGFYLCCKTDCSKYGEPFCLDCGRMTHRRKDHEFDPDQDHIKSVNLDTIKEVIKVST